VDKDTAGYALRPVTRVQGGVEEHADDWLAQEVPVAVLYDGEPFAVMMATPADLEDFAFGFSLTEGRVADANAIRSVAILEGLEGIELNISTDSGSTDGSSTDAPADLRQERLMPGRSGCGICGSRTLEEVVRHPATVGEGIRIDSATLERALASLRDSQPINAMTGSVHAAAWASEDGTLVKVREDVGRHNALDKLIGAMLREDIDPQRGFAVITSRASYEMVTKAATAGISLLAAISAPTALAVHLARDCGVTLVGFARPGRHVIYTHPQRMIQRG
jgi:FdhD protein